jgi:hypothetical protein
MITLQLMRTLPVSAASGLVFHQGPHQGWLYVVADDDHHLAVLSLADAAFHHTVRLFDGELPADKKARKKHKPDLEALACLPASERYPHRALLAIGSGSKANRQRAVVIPLNPEGLPAAVERTIDLAPLYAQLPFADLNIEGAVVMGTQLRLLQRGNNGSGENAIIDCNLNDLLNGSATPAITNVPLPCISGVQLGFTDAVALPDGRLLFSAVAEDTGNSYSDGACIGTAIGLLDASGALLHIETLPHPHKIEGLVLAEGNGNWLKVYAVTDADDPAVMASLLQLEWQL